MKKFGFLITILLASTLLFTGCGNSGSGNGGSVDEPINELVDLTAPEIRLKGPNPTTIVVGEEYIEKGVRVLDDTDTNGTEITVTEDIVDPLTVKFTGIVDNSTVGEYILTYTATDSSGNTASVTRTVIVEGDEVPPVITLLGQNPQTIEVGSPYEELGATAVDNIDGDITEQIQITNPVNVNQEGTYTVTYTVSDAAGNTDTETRTVNVIPVGADDTPPVITLLGANPQTIFLNGNYTELGATAIDDLDGDITSDIVIDASNVNVSVEGDYIVTYNVNDSTGNAATEVVRDVYVRDVVQPPSPTGDIVASPLACDTVDTTSSTDAADFNASQTLKRNVSSSSTEDVNRENPTGHNTIERLSTVVPARTPDGELVADADPVHPLLVSYVQQIVGSYEMGDGSADIGDPEHVDGVFVAVSQDNGDKWKNYTISDTTDKSSIQVLWDIDKNAEKIDYPGHAQKPTMAVEGNRILVAWNDKYCPSGNPHNLEQVDVDGNITYPTDYFGVNGTQGSIDYAETQDGAREEMIAPNGKYVYEVPFSCVWTARGFFNDEDGSITWTSPMQLTTGTRDSNHIKIATSDAGFALAWQEDTVGLKSGKGEGPGEGWSGATTGHGTDIWYTSIKMSEFDEINGTDENTSKPKSLYNFHYPVRITDNEKCQEDDTKPYCNYMCDTYGSVDANQSNNSGDAIKRCLTYDIDMLTDTQVVLDGDTGASRPALNILKTAAGQNVVVFGYEETKGLSESTPGEGDQDQGDSETIIALEGKSVYFESFLFEAIDDVNLSNDFATIMQTAKIPLVSAGNIVNVKVPDRLTGEMIYENARRLVIGTQIDSCDADRFNFAFMYKQSFETQGASSDMFIRVNNGLTYDSFTDLDGLTVTNISAQNYKIVDNPVDYNVTWDTGNLDDNTYENDQENTFSPRIFLRGNDIFTGFEYTPNEIKTKEEHMPSNFHAHIYRDGGWTGPQNITKVTKSDVTTVDARFFTTPKGDASTGLESDQSNPDVLFVTWGTVEGLQEDRAEADLYYVRSTDRGVTWDANASMLAARDGTTIQEKEVESFTNPDGKSIYNVWLQEVELDDYNPTDPYHGLDSWFGRVDYNISIAP